MAAAYYPGLLATTLLEPSVWRFSSVRCRVRLDNERQQSVLYCRLEKLRFSWRSKYFYFLEENIWLIIFFWSFIICDFNFSCVYWKCDDNLSRLQTLKCPYPGLGIAMILEFYTISLVLWSVNPIKILDFPQKCQLKIYFKSILHIRYYIVLRSIILWSLLVIFT